MRVIVMAVALAFVACDSPPTEPEWSVDVAAFFLAAPSGAVVGGRTLDVRGLIVAAQDSDGRDVAIESIPGEVVRHTWRDGGPRRTGWETRAPLPMGRPNMTLRIWVAGAGPEAVGVRVVDVPVVMRP